MGGSGWTGGKVSTVAALFAGAFVAAVAPARPAVPALLAAQVSFEQSLQDLSSPDAGTRLRTVQMLKDAAYPEAAVPLARLVVDPQDEVQLEAIAAELNIFLAEKITTRRRVGFVVEMRKSVAAEAAFSGGPLTIGARPVPADVLSSLLTATRDDNPRVSIEALYAFGTLAVQPGGAARRERLRTAGPVLTALVGVADPALRYGAVRVIGRVFERRPKDEAVDQGIGDALVAALNDRDREVKAEAMQALGSLRYDRAVQALTELFTYHGKGVEAEAALDAIARIASPGSAALFTAQLTSKTPAIRGIAVEGLARIGDPAQLPQIETALASERTDGVVLAVAFASGMLSDGAIDRLTEALPRPRLHDQAKQYLAEIAARRAAIFARHVQDPDPRIRADIADVLGLSDDEAALPIVEPLASDADPAVARAAARAVARLRVASLPQP
jgi:HEAT repeat protein